MIYRKSLPPRLPFLLLMLSVSVVGADDLSPVMPLKQDMTSMWWAEGFPSHSPNAGWHRCVQTGYYGFVHDTQSLQFPHFGPLDVRSALSSLPPARLDLKIKVNGKTYNCTGGGKWSKYDGPRLIESGRFFQRADVTQLTFEAADGERLNVEARFETAAWADRLGLILAARPGTGSVKPGGQSFGRVGGGFGLDGTNHLEIAHRPELDTEQFTLELWAFVPENYRPSQKSFPWLVCKNRNEQAEGNYGITIVNGVAQARLNIGGGPQNQFEATAGKRDALKLNSWNHLAIRYDGKVLTLSVNGKTAATQTVDRQRVTGNHPLAIGRRQDNSGDGYHFRGVIDEVTCYDRALSEVEIRRRFHRPDIAVQRGKPVGQRTFRSDGVASMTMPRERWNDATLSMGLYSKSASLDQSHQCLTNAENAENGGQWYEVSLSVDPVAFKVPDLPSGVTVEASEIPNGKSRPVEFDELRGWHRINLDGVEPIVPPVAVGRVEAQNNVSKTIDKDPRNDSMERIRLVLKNSGDREQVARLMFEKTQAGFRQRIGSAITGLSAILRDATGEPTGIPVQLSKNWHNDARAGVYRGTWLHAISQVRLPPRSSIELELSIVYGHWGGVAAASHAQLCLIGWGSNQLWHQSALGSWGESICYEPDQVQANCSITDVRPLMVRGLNGGKSWNWTCNVGGGDYFRMFNKAQDRVPHTRMQIADRRAGPCLTEIHYTGRLGKGIDHSATVSLARTDDVVRGTYRLRMKVHEATDFSRFVIFQIGADTYSSTGERKMAFGNQAGLTREWKTQWGGNTYRTEPMPCTGDVPWVSLHEAVSRTSKSTDNATDRAKAGAWANRGIVIRSWKARLGGKPATPWIAERGVKARGTDSSTLDIVPPPGVTRFEAGDFVEATIEHIVMPQFASDYYGPNNALRDALDQHENTWNMIHREAVGNDRSVNMTVGTIRRLNPDICIRTVNGNAVFTLKGGVGYVPVTLTELTSPDGHQIFVDGKALDQSVHGNDFWQTDYNPFTGHWSQTYNLEASDDTREIRFQSAKTASK